MNGGAQSPKRKRARIAALAGAAIAVGGVGLALGPLAPWLVDTIADGKRVWRLGRIEIDGVSGAHIGRLRAARVTLADERGVWGEARDVALDWNPFALLVGDVQLKAATASSVMLSRQPELSAPRPRGNRSIDVRLESIRVTRIDVAEAVVGEAAEFSLDMALDVRDQALRRLDAELVRRDSDADRFSVHYGDDEMHAMEVDFTGAAGGVFARLLGVGASDVGFEAQGEGDVNAGRVRFAGAVGEQVLADGVLGWAPESWRLESDVRFDTLPGLADLARRIGDNLKIDASGARTGEFSAYLETPFVTVQADGARKHGLTLDGPANVIAETPRLSDIARETPFEFGYARFEGDFTRDARGMRVDGVLDGQQLQVLGRTGRLSGRVEAEMTRARFTLTADLRAPDNMPALFEGARLNADMTYDRGARRYTLERARMQGAAIDVDARGWTNQGEGEYSGDWRLRRMGALFGELEGQAAGRWRAVSNPPPEGQTRRVWSLSFDGAGEGIAGAPDVIPQLLGRAPQLSGLLRFEDGGVRVSHARIEGAKLRMGAEGLIVSGQSDLRVEASARGPVVLGEVRFDGAADARGRLTGSIARPALNMSAQLASMHVSGVELAQPEITLILAPDGAGVYRGTGQARALVLGQAFHAEADLGFERDAVALPRLAAELGALRARGAGRFSARGPQASLSVEGALDGLSENVSGQVRGEVTLTPEMLSLDVALDNARAGDLRLRSATISAAGPYRAIEGRVDLTGALRRAPLAFHGALALTASDNGTTLSLSGDGELAGTDFSTRTPISARWSQGAVEVGLNVAIDQGAVAGHWREQGRALSGDFTIEDAPLAPLAAIWGERAEGRIAGVGSIRSEGQGLAGALNVTLTNARVSSRSRGRLNMQVNADLSPSRFTARVEARSDGGLEARFEAEAPVETSAAPIRIALAPERRGRASWSVRGPAEALWAAARLEDQSLSGALDGEGTLSFGAGALSGSGRIGLSGGRFEDKLSGVKLEELDAEVSIGAGGVTLERFTATDSRGGRLSATGGSADPRQGRIALRMDQLRLIDRPDARARANGDLVFAWDGLDSEITGAIEFLEADVSVAQSPASVVPQLDVIEINLPNSADEFTPPAPTRMNTRLDVALTAPRRIFTRGRGLEAEWSLDLRLGGTVAAPRLTGTATAVRGEIRLSGQPFIIDTGRIMFDGAAEDARIALTAERTTSELTARISLDGTARDPDITLSSNPALPEDEILPQVLFGRSVEDLSAFEAAQLAASLAALSGQASFDLLDAARAASGLDRFAVRQDEDGGLLVAGGVYLTRDVYLEVARTGLGQAATRVEWTVRPRLVLITSFLPNGDQRASVRWRRESD